MYNSLTFVGGMPGVWDRSGTMWPTDFKFSSAFLCGALKPLWTLFVQSIKKKTFWIWPLFTFLEVFYIPEAKCQPSAVRIFKLETYPLHIEETQETSGGTHPAVLTRLPEGHWERVWVPAKSNEWAKMARGCQIGRLSPLVCSNSSGLNIFHTPHFRGKAMHNLTFSAKYTRHRISVP